jgi:hypothetical protein
MFLKRSDPGERAIGEAIKEASTDFLKFLKQDNDTERIRNEAQQRELFAKALMERLETGEMTEKYANRPDALAKVFKQIAHASIMSTGLKLVADYNELSRKVYGP